MKVKVLQFDWMDKFQCIGGKCACTCCCTSWRIDLTEQEIEQYEQMSNPFRETLLKAVDKENKCMKSHKERNECALLTPEGWCRLVMECGEEWLSATCKQFPRFIRKYGDVWELTVRINCPVVAEYLFHSESIEFYFGEKEEMNLKIEPIDYEVYDSLSMARTQLIQLLQSYKGRFFIGKMYIILSVMYKLRELISQGLLTRENVRKKLELYQTQEVLAVLFKKGEEISCQYHKKAGMLQNFLIALYPHFNEKAKPYFVHDHMDLQDCISQWIISPDVLEQDLKGFSGYFKQTYQSLFENFFVYALFCDWIHLDTDEFGDLIVVRCIEFTMIQLYAMAWWKNHGEITQQDYALLCVYMERAMCANAAYQKELYTVLKENHYDSFYALLELCIC